jgi:hypothetical protein
MKFFRKWFAKKCRQAWEDARNDEAEMPISKAQLVTASRSIDSNGMNFTVYRANGGHVIETRQYDRKRDNNDHSLHIITDDKDLGEEIGKIITFERLKV